jgi:phosphoribosyl 1,2-cyclic phosphodiesterase
MKKTGNNFQVKFWGVRGSIAAPGPDFNKYGGNTSCVEVRCGDRIFIVDMGTGARPLGVELTRQAPVSATVLFSHYHYDHIGGAPFFAPFYDPRNSFEICGEGRKGMGLKAVLSRHMSYPFFPVPVKAWGSKIKYRTINPGDTIVSGDVKVKTASLNHPQSALAYRIEYQGKSVVYCSDNEHQEKMPAPLARLFEGCDLLIYDAAYTEDEYHGVVGGGPKIGWGHSTWTEAIKIAKRLNVRKLYIFHHDPLHTDEMVDRLLRESRREFKELYASQEGLVVNLD